MRKLFGFVFGALVGGLIGGTIALLFAPVAGQELRDQIRQRGVDFSSEVQGAARARRAELEARLSQLRAPRTTTPLPPPSA
jgi:gas vesicle protein